MDSRQEIEKFFQDKPQVMRLSPKYRSFLYLICGVVLSIAFVACGNEESGTVADEDDSETGPGGSSSNRPNIVLIVLDDSGYSDIGAFGSEIETPHIDRLVETGLQFTQFHVTPNCSSTRASLLTGMDHHRTGLGTHGPPAENQRGKPGYEGYLNNSVVTLPEVLLGAGYRTMMAGKWHVGSRDPITWPSERGFGDSFALLNGGASHWEDLAGVFPSQPSI